jgi:mRNA interferase MazF
VIQRGDIRWFRFDAPDKRRPVLILGRPDVLPSLSQLPVIPLSTQVRHLSWEVPLSPDDGLPAHCVLKTVDRRAVGPWIATFPEQRWHEVHTAVVEVLGLVSSSAGA